MNHASLFSGIGGFDLASEWMGWTNIFNCDIEPFTQKVLKYHFPNAIQYGDIKQTDFTIHRGQVDILTGGFPCQPYSVAGKRLGKNDERHLFPDMLRAIEEIKPRWVVGENVRGLVSWNDGVVFEETQVELEAQGYEVQSFILPAAGINAPHKRERVWIVASDTNSRGRNEGSQRQHDRGSEWEIRKSESDDRDGVWGISRAGGGNWSSTKPQSIRYSGEQYPESRKDWENFPTQSPVCGGYDGIPRELDSITFPRWRKESIKAYGNAIVPQIAYRIFKSIEAYETQQ